jgi:hypothetical protein
MIAIFANANHLQLILQYLIAGVKPCGQKYILWRHILNRGRRHAKLDSFVALPLLLVGMVLSCKTNHGQALIVEEKP